MRPTGSRSDSRGKSRCLRLAWARKLFLVCWASATALLALTYRSFSPVRLGWRPLLWGAASTGSFVSGTSLSWVLVLRFGADVGRAYGGSTLAGELVLFAAYLYLAQTVCLVGFALTLELTKRAES